jgi:hypothetical protein
MGPQQKVELAAAQAQGDVPVQGEASQVPEEDQQPIDQLAQH